MLVSTVSRVCLALPWHNVMWFSAVFAKRRISKRGSTDWRQIHKPVKAPDNEFESAN